MVVLNRLLQSPFLTVLEAFVEKVLQTILIFEVEEIQLIQTIDGH